MNTDIRIYVADLAAYNNGKFHGVWINACDELEDIQEQINKMLASSPEGFAEEYAIHDYEGFGGYSLGEYEGIEAAHEIACFIEEYPDFGGELIKHPAASSGVLISLFNLLVFNQLSPQGAGN